MIQNSQTPFQAALAYLLKKKGWGAQSYVARKIGKTQQHLSSLANGKAEGTERTRRQIADVFGISYSEMLEMGQNLIDGIPPDKNSPSAKKSAIPNPECRFVENYGERPPNWEHFHKEFIPVPLVSGEVAATRPVILNRHIEGWVVIHAPMLKGKKNLVATRVNDRAMEPGIRTGAIVCIDRNQRDITAGKIAAVSWNEKTVIRRLYKDGDALQLTSDNASKKFRQPINIDIKKLGYNPVIGRVVWACVAF